MTKICGSCRARYDEAGWDRLERQGAIASAEMQGVVVGWPDSAIIDLRRCAQCDRILARRASA